GYRMPGRLLHVPVRTKTKNLPAENVLFVAVNATFYSRVREQFERGIAAIGQDPSSQRKLIFLGFRRSRESNNRERRTDRLLRVSIPANNPVPGAMIRFLCGNRSRIRRRDSEPRTSDRSSPSLPMTGAGANSRERHR